MRCSSGLRNPAVSGSQGQTGRYRRRGRLFYRLAGCRSGKKQPVEVALRHAILAASFSVSRPGAQTSVPRPGISGSKARGI